ncbi:MAG: hypothetical protein ACI959_000840 [Limisphaerales bacterium]|jgi:hypothetical protein
MFAPKNVHACTCAKLEGKYNKLQNKYIAAIMAANALKASNYKARIVNLVKLNWKEIPGCPPPVLAPGWCPDPGGDDGGGGGVALPGGHGIGIICIAGDTARLQFFLRNADPGTAKTVTIRIKADSINPAGIFNLLDTFKNIVLPPLGTPGGSICTIDVEIFPLRLSGCKATLVSLLKSLMVNFGKKSSLVLWEFLISEWNL